MAEHESSWAIELQKAVYEASRSFIARYDAKRLDSFELIWNATKDHLGELSEGQAKLASLLANVGFGEGKGSQTPAIICIAIISQLFAKLSESESKPAKHLLRNMVEGMVQNNLDEPMKTNLIDHMVEMVYDSGIIESLIGPTVTEAKIYKNGREEWIDVSKVKEIDKDPSFDLIVNELGGFIRVQARGKKPSPVFLQPMHQKVLQKLCESWPNPMNASDFKDVFRDKEPSSLQGSVDQSISRIRDAHALLEMWVETVKGKLGHRLTDGVKSLVITKIKRERKV